MKLIDYRNTYYEASAKVSDLVRQLGFAGIAVVWIFKSTETGIDKVPDALVIPSFFLILSLSLDFLQYLVKTLIYGIFQRCKEKEFYKEMRGANSVVCQNLFDQDIKHPTWFNHPVLFCFWGKSLALIISYILIIKFLIMKFNVSSIFKQLF